MNAMVAVIGTIFVDCKGFARDNYQSEARNLGKIEFVHGGVGRNVAENLANMLLPTIFVSSVDASGIGNEIQENLSKLHVVTDYIYQAENAGMGMWLAILDETGNLAGSISQMPDLSYLQALISAKGEEIVQKSSHLVLEMDLNLTISESIISLAKRYHKPVYGIPGNLDIILSRPELLASVDCFICNQVEAERLIGAAIDAETPARAVETLVDYCERWKIPSMVITLGEKGSIFYDSRTKEKGNQPVFPVTMVDSSGAGDAFFSGTIMALIHKLSLKDAVVAGTKVAGWTIGSKENTCKSLSLKMSGDKFFNILQIN